jgi:hypothetical protein
VLLRAGWVRIAKGDEFKLRAAHQTKQIHLYGGKMRRYRDYGSIARFQAINCMVVIGHGYLDVRLPTIGEAERAERKARAAA